MLIMIDNGGHVDIDDEGRHELRRWWSSSIHGDGVASGSLNRSWLVATVAGCC